MTSTILNIAVELRQRKLRKPYVLSFATLESLESIQIKVTLDNGSERTAETVPLPGYSDETTASILEYLDRTLPKLYGKPVYEARREVVKSIPDNPFACSPLLTAIDLFSIDLQAPDTKSIPFVSPASSANISELKRILTEMEPGATVKIKLSGNLETDLFCIDELEKIPADYVFFRFDANQAFSFLDAQTFYEKVSSSPLLPRVHYIEQPLGPGAWNEHEFLAKNYKVKTMLDESIVTDQDLERAGDACIPFVKFKLFKQGGITELVHQIELANSRGIKVVIGNGVATDISNTIENAIYLQYKEKIFGASEANGFHKLDRT